MQTGGITVQTDFIARSLADTDRCIQRTTSSFSHNTHYVDYPGPRRDLAGPVAQRVRALPSYPMKAMEGCVDKLDAAKQVIGDVHVVSNMRCRYADSQDWGGPAQAVLRSTALKRGPYGARLPGSHRAEPASEGIE